MRKILTLLLLLCSSTLFSQIIYVDSSAKGKNNGTTWADAYTLLQDALTTATSGQIWVAKGTYLPDKGGGEINNARDATFHPKNNVALYGGFAGSESTLDQRNWHINKTILSGEIDSIAGNDGNSYHVITGSFIDGSAVLDGFVITGGNGNGNMYGAYSKGGGMYFYYASPTIRNCVFEKNFAYGGGAIYNDSHCSPQIRHCSFVDNSAISGGAIDNYYQSNPSIINSIFTKNHANYGGVILNYESTPEFIQCTIAGNSAAAGGVVYNNWESHVGFANCIVWNNGSNVFDNGDNCWVGISFSIVEGITGGTGNLNQDPLFVNLASGDFHLQACSPAIDAGTNSWAAHIATDMDGATRIINSQVDIGAYESQLPGTGPIIYVKADATGLKDGTSWANAYTRLQDALAKTSCLNEQIWVAKGTYYPTDSTTDRTASFVLKNRMTLYGGFSGTESALSQRNWRTNKTILSGDIDRDQTLANNSSTVVRTNGVSRNTVLDGLTITGGNTDGNGGGMLNINSSPTLRNCIITANRADKGGGIYNDHASPYLINCLLIGNGATGSSGFGGSMANVSSSPALVNCDILANNATSGGGVYSTGSAVTISNSILWGNHSGQVEGGGTVTYSIVQGGYTGIGNLDSNPLFADSATGNYHLQCGSPALDAGDTSKVTTTTDFDGNARIHNNKVDLGAYEFQGIFYVKADAAGQNNGSTWDNAFTSLQDALSIAITCPATTQIWVAKGTYYPDKGAGITDNDRTASFALKNGVAIYGGFTGTETLVTQRNPLVNETILSGEIQQDNDTSNNSYHVVTATTVNETAIFSDMIIRDGNANGTYAAPNSRGGGMYITASTLRIYSCTFTSNAAVEGGGIYNEGASPTIYRCILAFNSAIHGAGICNLGGSNPQILSCRFTDNKVHSGAGVYNDHSSPSIINCVFTRGNAANGGGIYNQYASPGIINCSIAGNTAVVGGGICNTNATPVIINTILWGNTGGQMHNAEKSPTVSYSIIQGGGYPGTGNLDQDPLFVEAAGGDLHLLGCSPAIDAGDNSMATLIDLDGKARIINNHVDLGAYEFFYRDPAAVPSIIYVDSAAITGLNNGSSWKNAFIHLQDALAKAATCTKTEVWIAGGTYYPDEGAVQAADDRNASFHLVKGVAIYGSFAGTEHSTFERNLHADKAKKTILSGEIQQDGNNINNAYHVVQIVDFTYEGILDGVVITSGNANGSDSADRAGGGIFCSSSPVISNCTIMGNTASLSGAGLYFYGGNPTITNCVISKNTSGENGGGIYTVYSQLNINNTLFWKNTAAGNGGAIYSNNAYPAITNCSFSGNTASVGGGLYNTMNTKATVTNSILWGNGNEIYNINVSNTAVSYSVVQGGYGGTGNLNADPLFADTTAANLHLQGCSPAIDAGNNGAATTQTDLDEIPRIFNQKVDMGAYEFQNTIIYVKHDATGLNNGTSWNNAFIHLQDALAQTPACRNTQIWVARGTYYPDEGVGRANNDRTASFYLKNNVAVLGGFSGTERTRTQRIDYLVHTANKTILSGEIDSVAGNSGNAYHVIRTSHVDSTALLDGFTITGGNANSNYGLYSSGGGIYNEWSSPTIANNIIEGNSANYGGGLDNTYSSPAITACSFNQNRATFGGAMYNYPNANPVISSCGFWKNSASSQGGAIYNYSVSPKVINCSFWGNTATFDGKAIMNTYSSPTITNTILWGGTGQIKDSSSTSAVSYSIVQGGFNGTANLDVDPKFIYADTGNLRLQSTSPAINAGNTAAIPAGVTTDLYGNARISKSGVDIGAAEYNESATEPPPSVPIVLHCPDNFILTTDPAKCEANISLTGARTATASGGKGPITITYSPASGATLPPGDNWITATARDSVGTTTTCGFWITVVDSTAPVISTITASPSVLYPPNHKMQPINLAYTTTDNCSPVTITLSVSSNEAVYTTSSDDIGPDWEVVDDHHVKLRAERSGIASDRLYTITVTATDSAGNATIKTVTVIVPHDNRAHLTTIHPVNGGELQGLTVSAIPNPSADGFTLTIQSPSMQPLTLKVLDAAGRMIEQRTGVNPNRTLYLGENYRPGVYYVQVIQGEAMQSVKLIKQSH